ncbi:hypothetical protein Ahy_B05g076226 isoform C [Arachis hypogaea]|uniref:Uncharacterized protein n=1 Tax=Arachis hypogaea TaxID=3818 RepID=A0A444Z2W5_ARAHY|nr:hypothetical protein Ahy_B05g076226 isoform C [Arachis hypogaea]
MKRRFETLSSLTRKRSIQFLAGASFLYLLLVTFEVPFVFTSLTRQDFSTATTRSSSTTTRLLSQHDLQHHQAPNRPFKTVSHNNLSPSQTHSQPGFLSGLTLDPNTFDPTRKDGSADLYKLADNAREVGLRLWTELQNPDVPKPKPVKPENRSGTCPSSVSVSGSEFSGVVALPCGLTLGSHVTKL